MYSNRAARTTQPAIWLVLALGGALALVAIVVWVGAGGAGQPVDGELSRANGHSVAETAVLKAPADRAASGGSRADVASGHVEIAGRCIDMTTGAAVSGATVVVHVVNRGRPADGEVLGPTTTDSSGGFTLETPRSGGWTELRVLADAPAYARTELTVAPEWVPGTRIVLNDVGLMPGVRMSGVVADASTGLNVPGTEVHLFDDQHHRKETIVTDSLGEFTTQQLVPPGDYYVRLFRSPGPAELRIVAGGRFYLDSNFAKQPHRIQIAPIEDLRVGRLLDVETGRPLGGTKIWAVSGLQVVRAITDREGRYSLHWNDGWDDGAALQLISDSYALVREYSLLDAAAAPAVLYARRVPLVWLSLSSAGQAVSGRNIAVSASFGMADTGILDNNIPDLNPESVEDWQVGVRPPAGLCVLRLVSPGHMPTYLVLDQAGLGGRQSTYSLDISAAKSLEVIVLDAAGQGVEGCVIESLVSVTGELAEHPRVWPDGRPLPLARASLSQVERELRSLAIKFDSVESGSGGAAVLAVGLGPRYGIRVSGVYRSPIMCPVSVDEWRSGRKVVRIGDSSRVSGRVTPVAWLGAYARLWSQGAGSLGASEGKSPQVIVTPEISSGRPNAALSDFIADIAPDGQFTIRRPTHGEATWGLIWYWPPREGAIARMEKRGPLAADGADLLIDLADHLPARCLLEFSGETVQAVRLSAIHPLRGSVSAEVASGGEVEIVMPGGVYEVEVRLIHGVWRRVARQWEVSPGPQIAKRLWNCQFGDLSIVVRPNRGTGAVAAVDSAGNQWFERWDGNRKSVELSHVAAGQVVIYAIPNEAVGRAEVVLANGDRDPAWTSSLVRVRDRERVTVDL